MTSSATSSEVTESMVSNAQQGAEKIRTSLETCMDHVMNGPVTVTRDEELGFCHPCT
jgi:hypothetical protein